MNALDAAKLLEVASEATPEQIETRFLELQAKLEDKIAKAPTPGLKVKYRESLAEITTAFETLTLAADSSTLPVLRRESESRGQKPETGSSSLPSAANRPPVAKRSAGREFALIGVIAVAVLGAGGWWVMKTRAENAEKERTAAAQKAATEEKAALEKKQAEDARVAKETADRNEKDRQEKLLTQLRTRMAELNVAYDAVMGTSQAADRELSDLKSQERDLGRDAKAEPSPALRAVSAQVGAQTLLVNWMRDRLPTHPAKLARVKAEELISSRVADDARVAVEAYAAGVTQLQSDLAAARKDFFTLSSSLKLSATPARVGYTLQDAYGRISRGQTPVELVDVPLGSATVSFQREGWPDLKQNVMIKRGESATASADLVGGALTVDSTPAQMAFVIEGQGQTVRGHTPAKFDELPVGAYAVTFQREGWADVKQNVSVGRGATAATRGEFSGGGQIKLTSTPAGAEVWSAGRKLGTTPLTLSEQGPGNVAFELRLDRYLPAQATGTLKSSGQLELATTLTHDKLTKEEAIADLQKRVAGTWKRSFTRVQFKGGGAAIGLHTSMTPTFFLKIVNIDPETQAVTSEYDGKVVDMGTFKVENGKLIWEVQGLMGLYNGTYDRVPDSDF